MRAFVFSIITLMLIFAAYFVSSPDRGFPLQSSVLTQRKLLAKADVFDEIAQTYIRENPTRSLSYNWNTAILLFGLARYSASHSANTEVANYLKTAFYELNSRNVKVTSPDLAAMALAGLEYLKTQPQENIKNIIQQTKIFFDTEERNEIGALNHVGRHQSFAWFLPQTHYFVGDSIWLDSIVMYGLTSLKLSEYLHDQELYQFSIRQPKIFARYLQNENGLFKHAYYLKSHNRTPLQGYWARGNGWMAMALTEYLDDTRLDQKTKEEFSFILKKQLHGFVKTLSSVHMAKTLLDYDSSSNYYETSASCLFGYALAKAYTYGLMSDVESLEGGRLIVNDLMGFVRVKNHQAELNQTSWATDSSDEPWYYTHIPTSSNISYGVGACLLFETGLEFKN